MIVTVSYDENDGIAIPPVCWYRDGNDGAACFYNKIGSMWLSTILNHRTETLAVTVTQMRHKYQRDLPTLITAVSRPVPASEQLPCSSVQ